MQLSQERAYGQDLWQEKVATAQTASGGIPGIAGIPGAPGAPGAPTSAIVVSPASSS
jgi:carbohydrate-binding DOMON domain-containing protein